MTAMQLIEPNRLADAAAKEWTSSGKPQMAYQCNDLDDVVSAVQYQIQTTATGLIPEEVVCRFQLSSSASLEYPKVKSAEKPSVNQDETPTTPRAADGGPIDSDPCPGYSIAAALSNFHDQKEKANYQRVVAKAVVGAVQYADGFRWSVRRTKDTSNNDGLRFSYVCRDSIQNINRPRGKKSGAEENSEPNTTLERASYDCKGGIKLLFSVKNLCVDVFYHHLPVHDYADQLDKQRKLQKKAMKANDSPLARPNDEAMAAAHSISYGFPQKQPQQPSEPPQKKRGRKKKGEETISQANGSALAFQKDPGLDTLANVASADAYGNFPLFDGQPYGVFNGQSTSSGEGSKPKHPRSRTGCLTCREKRIKCDEQRPTCTQCLKSRNRRNCEWRSQTSKAQTKETGSTAVPAKKRKKAPAESSSTGAGRAKPSPSKKTKKTKTAS
ncbi:hypothetical protein JOL62DRAFT_91491 [Phyllosticta paracitricarpa]|uniref:Zn(2)-C6 fungal-type domain-containing protein n=1 Tax=Phyllosticta paracitricarpa TaxID=2016321 RepID=A0ABR1N8H6_9PEZI